MKSSAQLAGCLGVAYSTNPPGPHLTAMAELIEQDRLENREEWIRQARATIQSWHPQAQILEHPFFALPKPPLDPRAVEAAKAIAERLRWGSPDTEEFAAAEIDRICFSKK